MHLVRRAIDLRKQPLEIDCPACARRRDYQFHGFVSVISRKAEKSLRITTSVIPSEVENGAAGEAATWTGRPEAERRGSERIKPRGITIGWFAGFLDPESFRGSD
jgi:hypothetical protein